MKKVYAPAKINLFLRVTGKRSDGYHELETLMCKVGLFDTILIDGNVKGIRVSCDTKGIPEDQRNLAYQAADAFSAALRKKNGTALKGVSIVLEKKIPVGAGLGGGSSDAASVLMELNRIYHHPFSENDLMQIGLSIGADVPFFIFDGPALATGIGEKLRSFETCAFFTVLIVHPGFSISTAYVYKNLNLGLTKEKKNHSNFLFSGKEFNVKRHLVNDLESVTIPEYPVLSDIKKMLISLGAKGALMSGSGSAVFGLFANPDRALFAQKTLMQKSHQPNWLIFLADLLI